MKVTPESPESARAKIQLVEWAEAHTALVKIAKADDGEGTVQAYDVAGVLVVTAHGGCAERITMLLEASGLATPIVVDERRIAAIKKSTAA